MPDRRYKSGITREQGFLLPPSVEDYVSPTNPVRAIDAYVDSLDMVELSFNNSEGGLSKGQPAYCPSDLLKLYLYGYLNRIRSSRCLERETYRNLEIIWLIKGLHPSYKTIADFRKNNLSALQSVNKDFVLLCQELKLYGGELVGIDGSFFNGNASKGSMQTQSKLKKQLARIESDIALYLEEIEAADSESEAQFLEDTHLQEKLVKLQERQKNYQDKLNDLKASGQTQLSSTDPEARLLKKRGQTTAGYNIQYAVDDKHKLLVVCDVVNDGNDTKQLFPMSRKAKEALAVENLDVAADSGYYNQAQLKDCQEAGITPYVAIPDHGGPVRKAGRFERKDFQFDEKHDVYQCPAGQYLERQSHLVKSGKVMNKYVSNSGHCRECRLKGRCLPKKTSYRQIYRYEHEAVVEAHKRRMDQCGKEYMKKRASLVEHPFGTLKLWMGWTHFLLRGLDKVRAEMDLLMLSYNFKRVLNIIGIGAFREYCLQRRRNNYLFFLLVKLIALICAQIKSIRGNRCTTHPNLLLFTYHTTGQRAECSNAK